MSISLLSLQVGHDEPATMGLNFWSLVFGIFIYSDFCFSTAFFICLDLCIFGSLWKLLILEILFVKKSFSYIYIYIYILPCTDRLFRCITTLQGG